ncbi:hypothetical protein [Trinickia symbiotica]|uniref:hypothetical protein n=1 Tax=Trinickia symbiotica TaxID=863227 RepID=UPI0011AFC1CF|nr:hypothetical protein [Trinickia symbiotica]
MPQVPSSEYGVLRGNFHSAAIDAAVLQEAAPGAYRAFGDRASLSSGTITDLSGNGEYAIGRWTQGADSNGATYNANQGRAWAVGKALALTIDEGSEYHCKFQAATRPVAINGNTPPGKVNAGAAKVYVKRQVLKSGDVSRRAVFDLSLEYSIGNDAAQTKAARAISIGYVSDPTDQHTFTSKLVGSDKAKPNLTVAYTMQAPTAGTVHGVAVMACEYHPPATNEQPPATDSQSGPLSQSDAAGDSPATIDTPSQQHEAPSVDQSQQAGQTDTADGSRATTDTSSVPADVPSGSPSEQAAQLDAAGGTSAVTETPSSQHDGPSARTPATAPESVVASIDWSEGEVLPTD